MTWGEVKQIVLQKIDEATGEDASEYMGSMAAPANEGLQLLSTTGKYITQCLELNQEQATRQRYDLRELTEDFFRLDKIYYEGPNQYGLTQDYTLEGERVLVLPPKAGKWLVYYSAYPREITGETKDEQPLAIDPEVIVLLPLYIASQIFKFDDISLSTIWRNEFEAGREGLAARYQQQAPGQAEFMDLDWM